MMSNLDKITEGGGLGWEMKFHRKAGGNGRESVEEKMEWMEGQVKPPIGIL